LEAPRVRTPPTWTGGDWQAFIVSFVLCMLIAVGFFSSRFRNDIAIGLTAGVVAFFASAVVTLVTRRKAWMLGRLIAATLTPLIFFCTCAVALG
jgi:uncharacterized membrane protein YoaT (DUF817 family)